MPVQILYDGTDSAAVSALSRIRHVTVQFMASPFASGADQQEFAAWEQHHWQWGNKPGNFRLMVKQGRSFGVKGEWTAAAMLSASICSLATRSSTSACCQRHALRTTGFGMERGLSLARQQQQDWLLHIDADEVVLPTSSALSLATCEHLFFLIFFEFFIVMYFFNAYQT